MIASEPKNVDAVVTLGELELRAKQPKDAVAAFDFGKRALAAGTESKAGNDLIRKSGSISAFAAEQLGNLDSAKSLRALSAGKISYPAIEGRI